MTIEAPEQVDVRRMPLTPESLEPGSLKLVASQQAIGAAEDVVVKLWKRLSKAEQARALPLRDAVRVLLIVSIDQAVDPAASDWAAHVRHLLEPCLEHRADLWWNEVFTVSLEATSTGSTEQPRGLRMPAVVTARPPRGLVSKDERRASMVSRIRKANAETLDRLAEL